MDNIMQSCMPPGFRFHPTEEELVGYYLERKINSMKNALDVITEIDLYKMEPWDIQARCKLGYEEQSEWYFFSHKDRKYPTGTRTNRATAAGFWKATGRDKAVMSKNNVIGMRKTLVYYKGRAPNGRKSDWIMHEYRLQNSEHAPVQEEGWVVCRAFKKPIPNQNQRPLSYEPWHNQNQTQVYHMDSNTNYSNHHMASSSSTQNLNQMFMSNNNNYNTNINQYQYSNMELPELNSPSLSPSLGTTKDQTEEEEEDKTTFNCVDWRTLDSLLETTQVKPQSTLITSHETESFQPQSFSSSTMMHHQSYNEAEANFHHSYAYFPDS